MIYKQFDINFLKRYFDLLSKHKRSVSKRYGNKCEKEIFVKRTFHKWFSGRYFAYIKHEDTGIYLYSENSYYADKSDSIKKPKKHFVYISGVNYTLGYSEELTILFNDPFESCFLNNFSFSFNDFLKLQFYEISEDKYKEVSNLFKDDREDIEFTMKAVKKNINGKNKGKYKEIFVKSFGKDYQEARENAVKNNPEMIIYG